ncbi:MAG: SGNH/GDSL hydrolase family protein [Candidatus Omnitrophota bacterium]
MRYKSFISFWFSRACLLIIGVVAAAMIAELILGSASFLYTKWQILKYRNISKYPVGEMAKDGHIFRILCFGDSSTYGRGVSPEYSYPYQLLAMLSKIKEKRFEIIVVSTGGVNSSQLTNRYERILQKEKFDLVVFQGGINDVHKFKECNFTLYRRNSFIKFGVNSRVLSLLKGALWNKSILPESINFFKYEEYGIGKHIFLDQKSLDKLYRYNLSRLMQLSKKYKVALWVQNYHSNGWMDPQIVLDKVLKDFDLYIIDQKSIFEYARGIRMKGDDGWHPNAYGYHLIACLIYNHMLKEGVITGNEYDIFGEIDMLRAYIKNKDHGYEYIMENEVVFNEKEFLAILRNLGIKLFFEDQRSLYFQMRSIFKE